MSRARNSDQIALNRELRERLHEGTEAPDAHGCWRYNPPDGSTQIQAQIYGQRGLQIVSVRRVAWAFAHEHEVGWDDQGRLKGCLGPDEEVITLCGTVGDQNTGHGQCVNPDHLGRGDKMSRTALHHSRRTIDKIMEATK